MRNTLTGTILLLSTFVSIFGHGLVMGLDENILRAQTQSASGDFLLQPTEESAIQLPTISDNNLLWTDRLLIKAELIEHDVRIPITLIGYNPQKRNSVFATNTWNKEGDWPQNRNEVAIGSGLYAMLDNPQKTTIAILSSTLGMNARRFRTTSIIHTQNPVLDSYGIWLPNHILEDFVGTKDKRTHILIRGTPPTSIPKGWSIRSAQEIAAPMLNVNSVRKKVLLSIYTLIMLIAVIGITSTTLMNIQERKRELALLRALGLSKNKILRLIFIEQIILSSFFILIGACIAGSINHHYSIVGFDLTTQSQALGSLSVSLMLYTHFSWIWITISILGTVCIATTPTLITAWFTSGIQPAQLIRAPR
jgi:ABC-type lipoprotein release transport system permease subunit